MARNRTDSPFVILMVELMNAPWPFGIILAIISYCVLGLWVPSMEVTTPMHEVILGMSAKFAPVVAGLFVLCSVISFFKSFQKK